MSKGGGAPQSRPPVRWGLVTALGIAVGLAAAGSLGLLSWFWPVSASPAAGLGQAAPEPEAPPASRRVGLPFRVPSGYVAELVAGQPLVTHPMFACFDDQGRLYVACSSGDNAGPDQLLAKPPNVIRRLEDSDGDGRFDKSTVFADRLTYPEGVLWHDGAVYTASPPSLWRLEDTDGDGVADLREELVTGFPFTGIADDLHGPSLGPDGRIYWGVGRFPYQIHVPGGPLIRQGTTPLIMRCKTNGTEAEVFSGAMGNPVEVTFTPEGEPFACGTFLAPESMGEGLRDAIVHCVLGGLYAVRDRVLNESKRTGDLLPPLSHLGVAAASGVARARGGPFGSADDNVLYSALYNMHKIERHAFTRDGASFHTKNEDFLVSDDPDFHPTDVLEDANGTLLVIDTGAWFDHCPTSQIEHSNVFGAIYRVRRQGAAAPDDPRGLKLDWNSFNPKALAGRLDDPRFTVRDRAVRELGKKGLGILPVLQEVLTHSPSARARRNAVWALCRMTGSKASAATLPALDDPSVSVRQAALVAVGLQRNAAAVPRLAAMLQTDDLPARREAATALARIRPRQATPALLDCLRTTDDRFLNHALIYALIEIADRKAMLAALADPSPRVRRGALVALDQMDGGALTAAQVVPFLDPADPALNQAALRVIAHHPAWATDMIEPLRKALSHEPPQSPARETLRQALRAFSADPAVLELLASLLEDAATPLESKVLILEALARTVFNGPPTPLLSAIDHCLNASDLRLVREAVSTVRVLSFPHFDATLLRLASETRLETDLRVEALETVSPRLESLDPAFLELLVSLLDSDSAPLLRLEAARALGQAPLDDGQLDHLTRSVAEAGALVLPRLISAFTRSHNAQVGTDLVEALGRAPGLRSLTPETLHKALDGYPAAVQAKAGPLFAKIQAEQGMQARRLGNFEKMVEVGDARQGREVFFGTKATCFTCHTINKEGGQVGPDLSRIGAVRSRRDLLEAILYPSATFARGYEPYVIATTDGRVFNGLLARETADALFIVTPTRAETPLPRSSIEAIEQSHVSIMPQGLEGNLTAQEFADLVAFLESLK